MSVISIETRKANELTATSNINDSSIFMVHDGTGLKRITFEDVKRAMVYPNAGSHNTIYRGKNLGSTVTQAQYTAIANGTFDDLFIGDYWTIGDLNYRIAAFDYYLGTGDTNCVQHHVVIVPDQCMYNHNINDTETTIGAYVGSKMYISGLNSAKTTIRNAFNGHVLSHRIYLANASTSGFVTNGIWKDSEVDLMCEQMVYGSTMFLATPNGVNMPANYKVEKSQLPLFKHDPSRIVSDRKQWWLRDVATDKSFAGIYHMGNSSHDNVTTVIGVRPFFCIH